MALPTSYMTGSFTKIPQYFDTLLTAKAPDKFTVKFMEDLGYTSSNDRQFVNVLKAIGLCWVYTSYNKHQYLKNS